VLFIALIAMVILMLAGVALVRSVDSSTSVAGNLAFRQASIAPVNEKIEEAINLLFKKPVPVITNTTANDLAHGYYASLQAGEKPNGVPAILAGPYGTMKAAYSGAGLPAEYVDALTKLEVRSVIERVCIPEVMDPAVAGVASTQYCDLLPPKVSPAGTDNEVKRIPLPPVPHFRVTIRVDLPNTNTVSYAQAFLR
jgi:hypothetical protein